MYVTCVLYMNLELPSAEIFPRGHGVVAMKVELKKELWKKQDMQRGNRVQAHRKTVQDKRASLNQVAGDPEPHRG